MVFQRMSTVLPEYAVLEVAEAPNVPLVVEDMERFHRN